MALDEQINKEDKLAKLNQLKKDILTEIYRFCVIMNIDTETFNYEEFQLDGNERPIGGDSMYVLKKNCSTVMAIDRKIEGINNA